MHKKEKVDEAKTVSKAMEEDWLKNKNNQMEEFLIDIGAAARWFIQSQSGHWKEMEIPWRVQIVSCQSAAETSRTSSNSICFSEKFIFS